MGRKGVTKRKLPKSKNPTAAGTSSNGAVSDLMRVTESPVVKSIGKGEASSTGKGRKKK